MSISSTKRIGAIRVSKSEVIKLARTGLSDVREQCFEHLFPSESVGLNEVRLKGTMLSYYPRLNMFMPHLGWIEANLNSSHTRSMCEGEIKAVADFAENMPEYQKPYNCILELVDNTFSTAVKRLNSDSSSLKLKDFLERCSFRKFYSTDPNSMVSALYRDYPTGMAMPVISPKGNVLNSVRKDEVLNVLVNCGCEVADRELASLLDRFARLTNGLHAIDVCNGSSEDGPLEELAKILLDGDEFSKLLLDSESVRLNHPRLPEKILKDPNQGHWDAWPTGGDSQDYMEVSLTTPVYARNPLVDVDKAGIVGIDFGTKSTIVAKWSGGEPEVLRIGLDDFCKKPEPHHYENPTMMEFVDIMSFVETYGGDRGRPPTRWADLKTSHEALGDLDGLSNNDIELSQSYFAGLKQWAGYGERKVVINDSNGEERELPPYEELKPGDFDPIEIYAYHVGLAVNNMSGRRIILRYLLSFPATFTLKAQEQILGSFGRGIRRALPQAILDDAEMMKLFKVEGGTSEPAAYAVCALKKLELKSEEGRCIPYAVFDFGGGTTDFDFGTWRLSTDEEIENEDVDYVIEHFGSGGDAFLGGENLLEDIAYKVYVSNRDVLVTRESQYPFAPPRDKIPLQSGFESLLTDSREGRMNRYRIAEKLRPLWEESSAGGVGKDIESGEIKVKLFDINGDKAREVTLKCVADELRDFIRSRIAKCIDSFVESMQRAFNRLTDDKKKMLDCPIHIFLAGNSSKSPFVKELFDERLKNIQQDFLAGKEKPENVDMFMVHEPFGVNGDMQSDFAHTPTGKTGVAFGLVDSAPGRKIKVVNNNRTQKGEAHFRFYAGGERRGVLKPVLNPDSLGKEGAWVDFCPASKPDGRAYLYFTRSGKGATGMFPTKEASCVPIEFEPRDGRILIRAIGPSEIEWCYGDSGAKPSKRPKDAASNIINLRERN